MTATYGTFVVDARTLHYIGYMTVLTVKQLFDAHIEAIRREFLFVRVFVHA